MNAAAKKKIDRKSPRSDALSVRVLCPLGYITAHRSAFLKIRRGSQAPAGPRGPPASSRRVAGCRVNESRAQGRLFRCDGTSLAITTDDRAISWLNPVL